MSRPIFHLSFPVPNLEEARRFYLDVMCCRQGRTRDTWLDVYLWGHQITIHQIPDQVLTSEQLGVRHFGIVLSWEAWESFGHHLEKTKAHIHAGPTIKYEGTSRQQGKILLRDPGNNIIEIKAYTDRDAALELPDQV